MPSKQPYLSKTVWIGFFSALLGGVAYFWPNANFALQWLNANGALITSIWGVLAIGLRAVTKNAISLQD